MEDYINDGSFVKIKDGLIIISVWSPTEEKILQDLIVYKKRGYQVCSPIVNLDSGECMYRTRVSKKLMKR